VIDGDLKKPWHMARMQVHREDAVSRQWSTVADEARSDDYGSRASPCVLAVRMGRAV